jgi:hypothetical protein
VLSARYNLLARTEEFDNAVWGKFSSATATDISALAPDNTLTADRIQLTTNSASEVSQIFSTTLGANVTYIGSVYLKSNTGLNQTVRLKNTHAGVADTFLTVTVTTEWQRFTLSVTNGVSAGTGQRFGITNSTNGLSKDILAWGADLRVSNNGVGLPVYQRVVTGVAGTSLVAGTSDYDTVGFPPYLKFDGTDDALETSSINFTATDKMSLWTGIRQIGSTTATLCELSITFATAGGFGVSCPPPTGANNFRGYENNVGVAATSTTFSPPSTFVANIAYNNTTTLGQASVANRINGTPNPVSAGTGTGGGNFVNDKIYIGGRAGTSSYFNGQIYSLIVRGALSTATQITDTETYVNSKTKAY